MLLQKKTTVTPFPKTFKPYLKNENFNPWSLIPAVLGGVTASIGSLIPNPVILLALFLGGFGLEIILEKMRQSDAKETNETFKQALDNLKNEAKERPLSTPLTPKELEPFEPQQQKEPIQWMNNILSPPLAIGFLTFVVSALALAEKYKKNSLPIAAGVTLLTSGVAIAFEKNRQEHAKQENQQFKKKLQDYIA